MKNTMNQVIKVVVPTRDEINRLTEFGVDVEALLVRAFINELHPFFHKGENEK